MNSGARAVSVAAALAWSSLSSSLVAQNSSQPSPGFGQSEPLASASGEVLYQASCANCHGADGRGLPQALVGFAEELPDFTDCDFAAREPDGDWIAVAHEGGPVRGFSEMMPAFRGALSEEQLGRVMAYIRTLCTDKRWPRGELNLPRALITEKAYPEDEWVIEGQASWTREVVSAFVYEKRFGPRSQWELVIPFGWRDPAPGGSPPHEGGERADRAGAGLGDIVLGIKHAAFHSIESGSILSFGGELILPTGAEGKGLGRDGAVAEIFSSFGQILAGDAFLQAQAGVELPLYESGEREGFARLVLGRGFSQGKWGRGWTPMVELVASRGLWRDGKIHADLVPQIQVALNTRQHVLANAGVQIPAIRGEGRSVRFLAYVLLDWFDGGFFEGW